MALYWRPQGTARPQIDSITVANTWASGDTGSVQIGNATLTITAKSGTTTTATVAAAIKNAINATGTSDNLVANESRSAGGQEIPEFRDVLAYIDPTNSSVVLVRSRVAGVPFYAVGSTTLTVSEVTGGTGTLTAASVQTAIGQWHWSNALNWDTGAVPTNGDIVVFDQGSVGPQYGLPNGADLEAVLQTHMSFEGWGGLPPVNPLGYQEYRERYIELDNGGGGSAFAHRFGIGKVGRGSPLFNVKHTGAAAAPIVFNTGQPLSPNASALNICCTVSTSTINILNGFVDISSQDGSTSAFVTVNQSGGKVKSSSGTTTDASIALSGGEMTLGGSSTLIAVTVSGGLLRLENQSGAPATVTLYGGSLEYSSTATIANLILIGGTFDTRQGTGGFTITSTDLYNASSKLLDPGRRVTFTNAINVFFEVSPNIQLGGSGSNALRLNN